MTGDLDEATLSKFTVVVLTDSALSEQLRVNAITHAKDVCFISARTPGLFSQIFCDFGGSFTVSDVNGENPISTLCASITKEANGVVTCLDESRHGLEDGDHVSFSELVGMTELNDTEPRPVKVRTLHAPCSMFPPDWPGL